MRARFLILIVMLLMMWYGVTNFDPRAETYVGMHVRVVNGKPYLILAETHTFSIYEPTVKETPAGKEIDGWRVIYENRGGIALGTFEIPPPPEKPKTEPPDKNTALETPPEKPPEVIKSTEKTTINNAPRDAKKPDAEAEKPAFGLGVFFETRSAIFNVAKPSPDSAAVKPYPFKWIPETWARLNGQDFAFGKDNDALEEGPLRAARFDGKSWTEISTAKGPQIKPNFLIHAVETGGRIVLLWRGAKADQLLGEGIEGVRFVTAGEVKMASFDGEKFSPQVLSAGEFPKGNFSAWAENGAVKVLVQTRANQKDGAGKKGRVELWSIDPATGKAQLSETLTPERSTIGLFPFLSAERFKWGEREYMLRSTWQNFDMWTRPSGGEWKQSNEGVNGLPTLGLEQRLYTGLGFCAGLILMGAWLAYLRRKQAITLLKKLTPRDLYAPLGIRAMAYFADFFLVCILAIATSRLYSEPFQNVVPYESYIAQPALSFVISYALYFVGCEWLLGATPGKYLMGLRVVSDGGKKPPLWAIVVRNAVGLYERQLWMLLVAAPMILFSPRRQRLGDLLSRTFVVQKQGLDLFLAQQAEAGKGDAIEKLPEDPVLNIDKNNKPKP